MKVFAPEALAGAPEGFLSKPFRSKDLVGHLMTIQVAPDDCTGCGVCVDVCPAKSKTEVKHKSINMETGGRPSRARASALGLLQGHPGAGPLPAAPRLGEGCPGPPAAVRVLRSLRRVRRDAVPEAGQPAVRRPHARGQRHRLLVDLRRQPADDPVGHQRRRTGAGVGQLTVRGQRRVRPRHPDGPRGRGTSGRAPCSRLWPGRSGPSSPPRSSKPTRTNEEGVFAQRQRVGPAQRGAGPAGRRRTTTSPLLPPATLRRARGRACPQERLDHRRRRLGL